MKKAINLAVLFVFLGTLYSYGQTASQELQCDNCDSKLLFHDPFNVFYSLGIDYSDAGKFKINYGGNVGDNSHFTMTSIGNIGIGTNSPFARFHVADNQINIYSSTGSSNSWSKDGLTVYANPDAGYNVLKIHSDHSNVSNRGLIKVTRGNDDILYVRNDGKVGIGTSSPNAQFHVLSPSGQSALYVEANDSWIGYLDGKNYFRNTSVFAETNANDRVGVGTATPAQKLTVYDGNLLLKVANNSNEASLLYQNSGSAYVWKVSRTPTTDLAFSSGSSSDPTSLTPKVTFKNNGNVGIGTTSPTSILEIAGNSSNIPIVRIKGENDLNPTLRFNEGGNWQGGFMKYIPVSNSFVIGAHDANNKSETDDLLAIAINRTNGDVGIGTTTTDSKLTVKGIIHAEEVKVDLSVPGPDYVFEEDYPLASLEDTKAYIEQNKHLPGIPSSVEMQQNGVNLLEMNMKLLEKVEELTLHLIEQKEMHTNLESTLLQKIEALEKKLDSLK